VKMVSVRTAGYETGLPTDHVVYLICNTSGLASQVLKCSGNHVNYVVGNGMVKREEDEVVSCG
jgi:hypothetical protein